MSTLVTDQELKDRLQKEGLANAVVCAPRWAESAPRHRHESSAVVVCDTVLRSDGSAVWLDGMMSMDGIAISQKHLGNRQFSLASTYRKMLYAPKSQRRKRVNRFRRKFRKFCEYVDSLR
jgi:hypothetical protein